MKFPASHTHTPVASSTTLVAHPPLYTCSCLTILPVHRPHTLLLPHIWSFCFYTHLPHTHLRTPVPILFPTNLFLECLKIMARINRDFLVRNFFFSLEIHLNFPKFFSNCLISSFTFTTDEILARVPVDYREVKMDFKSRNSSKKKLHT